MRIGKWIVSGLFALTAVVGADIVNVVYQDDFSWEGVTVEAISSVPEVSLPGYSASSAAVSISNEGRIFASAIAPNADFRFLIDSTPLTADSETTAIKWSSVLKTPTTGYVAIGFMENDGFGFFNNTVNSGPFVKLDATTLQVFGGGNAENASGNYDMTSVYTGGDVIEIESVYHLDAGTVDVLINGSVVVSGFEINHEYPAGAASDPIISRAQIVLSNQPENGAYIDNFTIETLSDFSEKPNIIFILADDLGWRDTGVYGSTYYQTPNIDKLANQGMRFTDAYSASPLCSPTRASIMSGQYPARTGLTAAHGHLKEILLKPTIATSASPLFKAVAPQSVTRLDTTFYTLGEAIRDAGYATAHFGKWHMGDGQFMARNQGFDVTIDGGGYPAPVSYFSPYNMENVPNGPKGEHIDRMLTEHAIRFIRENRDSPFYINLWLYSVHGPFQADKDLILKYEKLRDSDNPQNFPIMGAMIETMDDCVGKVMAALDELGLDDNTLVIFTSDNGGLVQKNGYYSKDAPTSNAPLRAGKGYTYEGGTRVPLILSWPDRIKPKSICNSLVSSVDFYPTLVDLAGAKLPEEQVLDGTSLLPLVTNSEALIERDIFCFFPHYLEYVNGRHLVEPSATIRHGDFKLIRFFASDSGKKDKLELYNLKDDVGETQNLASEMPEKTKVLNKLIEKYLAETQACVPFTNTQFNPNVRLKQFGNTYVTFCQSDELYISIFNAVPLYEKELTVELTMDSPSSGTLSWSTIDLPNMQKNAVRFVPDEFDSATLSLPVGNGNSRIKDIRINLQGAESGSLVGLRLTAASGKEVLTVDFND